MTINSLPFVSAFTSFKADVKKRKTVNLSLRKLYKKDTWIFFALLVIFVGSQLILGWRAQVGVYTNAAELALLIGLAIWQQKVRKLAIVVAIFPLINMLMLSLPLYQYTRFTQSVIFYDSLLLMALVYRFMFSLDQPLKSTKLKLKGYLTYLPLAIVAGEILGLIGYGLLRHHYQFSGFSDGIVAANAIVFAIVEEVYFRGLIQGQASRIMNPISAAVLSTVIYGVALYDHATILTLAYGLIAGALLASIYYFKQNLVLSVVANSLAKLTYIWLLATFIFR